MMKQEICQVLEGGPALPAKKDESLRYRLYGGVNTFFDKLEHCRESQRTRKATATLLVLSFILTLIVIEMNRRGLLPPSFEGLIPKSHFYVVSLSFTLLLTIEVIELVLALAHSAADAVGKQIEILALVAPPHFKAAMAVYAALFALGLTLAYNAFAPADEKG